MTSGIRVGHVLGVAAFLMLPLAIFAARGLAPLFIATVLGVLLLVRSGGLALPRFPKRVAIPLALLMVYGGLTAAWAVDWTDTLSAWPRLVLLFLGGLLLVDVGNRLPARDRAITGVGIVIGLAAGMALLGVEVLADGAVTQFLRDLAQSRQRASSILFNRAATVLAILIWAGVVVLARSGRRWLAAAVPLLALLLTSQTESGAAVLGIVIGLIVFPVALAMPTWAPRLLAVGLAAGILLAPVIVRVSSNLPQFTAVAEQKTTSDAHRLHIWNYTVDLIAEKPVFGWGLDGSRSLNNGPTFHRGQRMDLLPLHPHNGALQVWLELGLIGALAAAGVAVAVALAIARAVNGRLERAACVSAVVAATTILCISYGVWQWWWQSALWLSAAMTLAVAVDPAARRVPAVVEDGP